MSKETADYLQRFQLTLLRVPASKEDLDIALLVVTCSNDEWSEIVLLVFGAKLL